jgi:hypothetical protein
MSDTYQAIYDAVRSRIGSCDIASAVENAVRSGVDASFAIEGIKTDFYATLAEYRRPSAVFRPKIYIDGDQWCALYGQNLQDGVAGFGSSPELATQEFDKNWHNNIAARKP